MPIPGDTTITLPVGQLTLNYDEARKGREADDGSGKTLWLGLPDGLAVTITPAAGGSALTIEPTRGHHDYSTLRRIGSRYGKVEIPAEGEYTISVAPLPPSDRELYGPVLKLKT